MAARAKARGARFVLDASGEALRTALDEGVFMIKPNLRELQDLTGESLNDEAAAVAAAQRLVQAGQAELVALSQGAKGALLIAGDGVWKAEAISVPVASSVGAGDSFLAAFVWALTCDEPHVEAFRYALAAGAAALTRPGTELCRREDVMRLRALAQPRRI
jgi:6-phosphofructokinase 2